MFQKLDTYLHLGNKFFAAFVSFGCSVIIGNVLGPEAFGEIALVILTTAISIIIGGIYSGPNLIYFAKNNSSKNLSVIGYTSAILSSTLIPTFFCLIGKLHIQHLAYTILIVFFQSICNVNTYIILGQNKINKYNLITFIQPFILIVSIIIFFYFLKSPSIERYLLCLLISYAIASIISFSFVENKIKETKTVLKTIKELTEFGLIVQITNLIQLLNYRFSYYVIEWQLGLASLGVFAASMQIVEGVWLVSKSFSQILLADLLHTENATDLKTKTIRTAQITFVITSILMVGCLILPEMFYQILFGNKFLGIKPILWIVSIGVLLFSVLSIFSSYFSSQKKVIYNFYSSLVGFIFVLLLSIPFISEFKLMGAGAVNLISYIGTFIVGLIIINNVYKIQISELLKYKK